MSEDNNQNQPPGNPRNQDTGGQHAPQGGHQGQQTPGQEHHSRQPSQGQHPPGQGQAPGQPPQGQPGYEQTQTGPTFGPEFQKFGKFAVSTYLTFGLGLALTLFLFFSLAPRGTASSLPFGSGLGGSGAVLFASMIFAFAFGVFLSPLLAVGIGVYVGQTADMATSAPLVAAAVNGGGVVVVELLLILLALVFAPAGGGGSPGQLFGPLIGTAIAISIVGAAGGAIGERVDTW